MSAVLPLGSLALLVAALGWFRWSLRRLRRSTQRGGRR